MTRILRYLEHCRRALIWPLAAAGIGLVWNNFSDHPIPLRQRQHLAARQSVGSELREQGGAVITLNDLAVVQKAGAIVIDVRDPVFFNAGHIAGAINVALADLEAGTEEAFARLGKTDMRIVVYCESETCPDAMRAANVLIDSGYKRVAVFAGGWRAWKQSKGL